MEQTIRDFVNELLLNRSEMTAAAYEWEVRRLATRFPDKRPRDFEPRDLALYMAERKVQAKASDAARKRSVAAFRSFFGWACGKTNSPARRLKYPEKVTPIREPRTLTRQQLDAVLAIFDTSTMVGKRNIAMIAVMVDSRLRVSEVCRLRALDIDFENRRLSAKVKGNRRDIRKFSPATKAHLESWLSVRPECETETLFVGLGGSRQNEAGEWVQSFGKPLTAAGVRANFRRMGLAAGLTQGFSPHDLCRTYATLVAINGAPSRIGRIGGGWSSDELYDLYTRALQVDEIDQYLPMRGKLGGGTPAA